MIEVFADIVCPFTHVGLTRLAARRAELRRSGIVFMIRSWPLEWVNGEPVDPALIAHEVELLRSGVAPDLFTNFDPDRFPASTVPALALSAAAYGVSPGVGERVAFEVRDLLFEQGADIGDRSVLEAVAARHELSRPDTIDAVEADYEEGQQRGVLGSPHFFVDGTGTFCPSLDITRPDGDMHIEFDHDAFDAFADTAFTR